jgi:hypothetical protein
MSKVCFGLAPHALKGCSRFSQAAIQCCSSSTNGFWYPKVTTSVPAIDVHATWRARSNKTVSGHHRLMLSCNEARVAPLNLSHRRNAIEIWSIRKATDIFPQQPLRVLPAMSTTWSRGLKKILASIQRSPTLLGRCPAQRRYSSDLRSSHFMRVSLNPVEAT